MTSSDPIVSPGTEVELAEFIADCAARGSGLRIMGGGTRTPPGAGTQTLTVRDLDGIVTYEPGELTLIARAGTPVDLIETMLAAEGQSLAFEPMDHRSLLGTEGTPTIGGVVAANVSGPRRIHAGACRDHLLGVRFIDGRGRIIRNGGRVMKNVTGMDLTKLMCGSMGTLGVLTEVALKTLPLARAQTTLAFGALSPRQAVDLFCAALATPFEVSGAAFHAGTAWLRIEGLPAQVIYRRDRLAGLSRDQRAEILDDADSRELWRGLRDVRHFATHPGAIWRIFTKPTDAPQALQALDRLGGQASLDWGGALIWYCGDAAPAVIRAAVPDGIATRIRLGAVATGAVFAPKAPGVAAITAALRRTFDPAGILNPGLMEG